MGENGLGECFVLARKERCHSPRYPCGHTAGIRQEKEEVSVNVV